MFLKVLDVRSGKLLCDRSSVTEGSGTLYASPACEVLIPGFCLILPGTFFIYSVDYLLRI